MLIWGFLVRSGYIFSLFLQVNQDRNSTRMLSGYFFDIQLYETTIPDQGQCHVRAVVSLNAEHPVFQGHFPGNPVVPGVCQVQMVKELIEKAVGMPLMLRESDNIKFLAMISPVAVPLVELSIQLRNTNEKVISATATIGSAEKIFLKFKGKFESGSNG
jgi:3-hydroxyacyl-[acyl-carrier-protein] dehydratase